MEPSDSLKCPYCEKQARTKLGLATHVRFKHNGSAQASASGSSGTPTTPAPQSKEQAQVLDPSVLNDIKALITESAKSSVKDLIEDLLKERAKQESSADHESDGNGYRLVGKDINIETLKLPKSIPVSPIVQFYYDYTQANGANYSSIAEFVEDAITEHFSECLGLEISVVKHDAFRRRDGGVGRWVR